MIFWLTVQTGISDPELVFVSHSFPLWTSEAALLFSNSMDSIPADKVLRKTQLDLQKRFPICHACPKYLAAHCCGSAVPQNGSAFLQVSDVLGKTQVDW